MVLAQASAVQAKTSLAAAVADMAVVAVAVTTPHSGLQAHRAEVLAARLGRPASSTALHPVAMALAPPLGGMEPQDKTVQSG